MWKEKICTAPNISYSIYSYYLVKNLLYLNILHVCRKLCNYNTFSQYWISSNEISQLINFILCLSRHGSLIPVRRQIQWTISFVFTKQTEFFPFTFVPQRVCPFSSERTTIPIVYFLDTQHRYFEDKG